eukprot:m.136353 g.136353  ORF g.136353 m.136353 type:complete len:549 (+) comp14730_c0_seq5:39-1685(+)
MVGKPTPEHIALSNDSGKGSKKHHEEPGRKNKRKRKDISLKNLDNYKRKAPSVNVKGIKDKKLKSSLAKYAKKGEDAAYQAVRAEILLPEEAGLMEAEGLEKTFNFTQSEIVKHVDIAASRKVFDLRLDQLGPYKLRYTRNGRHLLLGGRKGHVASFDWKTGTLGCEIQLAETVRDVTWLHNNDMFAVAQKRHTYIYDGSGAEVHVLRKHLDPLCLEFLPYHFLLASVGNAGWLKYQDVSIGELVVELRTKQGPCRVMRQNPHNAILHLGHNNGTVTLWTPNLSTFAVKQLCHRGPVQALAVDVQGRYMATAGLDGQLKIWDIRNFKSEPLEKYFTRQCGTDIDISQRNQLAVAIKGGVQVWSNPFTSKQQSPYMNHRIPGCLIEQCRFSAFEDVLGLGHSHGFSSILVPGSGEPNFDSMEANVFETQTQKRETEVKQVLEKIPSNLISLNPTDILRVRRTPASIAREGTGSDNEEEMKKKVEIRKKKARGRNSVKLRFLRKKRNVIDQARENLKQKLEKEKEARRRERTGPSPPPTALDRFNPKPEA